jgi:hypothetical protein
LYWVLDPEDATINFGYDVDIDGDTIVVGASDSSAAFVFVKGEGGWKIQANMIAAFAFVKGEGGWTLQAKLTPSDGGSGFGWSVAVDGDRIVVGSPFANGNVGAAYVFERSGTSWKQTDLLTSSDSAAGGIFWTSVDLEGDAIVVGAYGRNKNKRAVYLFTLNGATLW